MNINNYYQDILTKSEGKSLVTGDLDLANTVLNASYIKNLEFNLSISRNENENLIFHLPILRSLCEDVIFINYLFNVIDEEDRHNFILVYQASDWEKSIKAQDEYFTANRDFQPILTKKMIDDIVFSKIDIQTILLNLKDKYNWQRKYPTVKQIATDGSLLNLYNYLYAATSRLVHFNPQTLLQMVWGEFESSDKKKVKKMKITIDYYKKYYNEFCLFYGFTLFKIFTEKFQTIIGLNIKKELEKIEEYFKTKRWPELITFEEMNIPLENGRKLFHYEKNGLEGMIAESIKINMEKEKSGIQQSIKRQ